MLVVDAYYASRKILRPLLAAGHHVITRVRFNAVAYCRAAQPAKRGPGRPRFYGQKIRLRDLWRTRSHQFQTAASPIYGESDVTLRYFTIDLLWRPVGQLVSFVLVEHPRRGRLILMSTDLTLLPLELIACYGYRFKIEVAFKQALYTVGTYAYHFWMMAMTPLSRRSGMTCIVRLKSTVSRCGGNSTLTIATCSSAASRRGCCSISRYLFALMFGCTSEAGYAR